MTSPLWMGGVVPLGYDPHPDKTIRGLVINEEEAAHVRRIFDLYDQLGSLNALRAACEANGIRSKRRPPDKRGRSGGHIMTNGQLHHLLTNPLYIGQIRHKDRLYDGQHAPIVDADLWERVQNKLISASARKCGQHKSDHTPIAPLKGKLFDETGDHLTPSHTKKKGRILRYYISNRLLRSKDPSGWRLSAPDLEQAIYHCIATHLQTTPLPYCDSCSLTDYEHARDRLQDLAKASAAELFPVILRVDLGPNQVCIQIDAEFLGKALRLPIDILNTLAHIKNSLTLQKRKAGRSIIIGTARTEPDPKLRKAMALAMTWVDLLKQGKTLTDVATQAQARPEHIRKYLKLATLSPKIQHAIITGHPSLTWQLTDFIRATDLPLDWRAQDARILQVSVNS